MSRADETLEVRIGDGAARATPFLFRPSK